jgi:hypothetical protein
MQVIVKCSDPDAKTPGPSAEPPSSDRGTLTANTNLDIDESFASLLQKRVDAGGSRN